jgi:hypothetical protein
MEKFNDLIGNLIRDLPACSIVPQLSMLPRALVTIDLYLKLTGMEMNELNLFKISKNGSGNYT